METVARRSQRTNPRLYSKMVPHSNPDLISEPTQRQQDWHVELERSWAGHEVMLGPQGGTRDKKSEGGRAGHLQEPQYRAGNGNLARPGPLGRP